MTDITRKQAEAALAAIKQQFSDYIVKGYEPVLIQDWESWISGRMVDWVILWEDGAPYEWAIRARQGGLDEELSALTGSQVETAPVASWPEGVWCEPCTGYVLALYPTNY